MERVKSQAIAAFAGVFGCVAIQSAVVFGQVPPVTLAGSAPPKPASIGVSNDLAGSLRQTLQMTVLIDQPGDGATWARGLTYKARFGSDGFTYIPFLGSNAPRNYLVQFTIAEVLVNGNALRLDEHAAPSVDGTRITFDRGGVREIYDLQPQAIEQIFEIDPEFRRSGGDVVVRLKVASDLPAQNLADGIVLRNDLGQVRYGQAAALDAQSAKVNIPTRLTDAGDIEISVPAGFAAPRNQALVIDPVITTVAVENGIDGTRDPDVAYDVESQGYGVAFEQFYSATDSDVYCVMVGQAGALVPGSLVQIDFTTDVWKRPRISNLRVGNQFLVAAEVGVVPTRIIRGRTRVAANNNMSAQFTISDGAVAGDKHNVDIGGEPYVDTTTNWVVVWERDFNANDHDVHGRLVTNLAVPTGSTILFDNSLAFDSNPQISNSDDGFVFLLVWQRTVGSSHDIYGTTLNDIGTIEASSFGIDTSSDDDTLPAVSARSNPGVSFLVVYQENGGDLFARLMQNFTLVAQGNLTSLSGVAPGTIQLMPSVDTDGTKFIVTYAEQFSFNQSDHDIYAQTFCKDGFNLKAAEGRRNLAYSNSDELGPRVACVSNSANFGRGAMIVWHNGGPADYGDVTAATYITPLACCPADIYPNGGNGVVNIDDLVRVITQWSAFCLSCSGDINGDLAVNIDDLVAIITAWGGCP